MCICARGPEQLAEAAVEVEAETGKAIETGMQNTVSSANSNGRSFVLPSINLATQFRSDSSGLGQDRYRAQSYLLGRLALRRVSGRSELLLDYIGGGLISAERDGTNSLVQALEFTRTVSGPRSSVLLGAAVSYLSESSFGFSGFAGFDNTYESDPVGGALVGTAGHRPRRDRPLTRSGEHP